ncbi:hypothetical protein DOY81_008905, partial [Sarcophaga bullata]
CHQSTRFKKPGVTKRATSTAKSESVYEKLRMFNGQSGGWAWYPGNTATAHLALPPTPATATLTGQITREEILKRDSESSDRVSRCSYTYSPQSYTYSPQYGQSKESNNSSETDSPIGRCFAYSVRKRGRNNSECSADIKRFRRGSYSEYSSSGSSCNEGKRIR